MRAHCLDLHTVAQSDDTLKGLSVFTPSLHLEWEEGIVCRSKDAATSDR